MIKSIAIDHYELFFLIVQRLNQNSSLGKLMEKIIPTDLISFYPTHTIFKFF